MSMVIMTDREEYHPGDVLRGYVHVVLDKPVKARGIFVSFEGREHARVTRRSGENRNTYIQSVMLVQDTVAIWRPEGEGMIGPCNEQYTFEFHIPDDTMPTLGSHFAYTISDTALSKGIRRTVPSMLNGYIQYMIHAKVDRPLAIDIKARHFITVTIPPRSGASLQPLAFTSADGQGEYRVDVALDRNMVSPGEHVSGHFLFQRNPQWTVRALEAILRFNVSITAQGRTDVYKQVADVERFPVDEGTEGIERSFSLGSFPGGPVSVPGCIVKLVWMLEMKVDLPGRIDKHVYVPVWVIPLVAVKLPSSEQREVVEGKGWTADEGNLVVTDSGDSLWQVDPAGDGDLPEGQAADPEEDALWERDP
ncbi:MAG: hypothetical protein JW839_12665 [Candidatus Lokiarchaeota archaeon]|nr:hypothetical protein [Candidatus Lokiarchaeota archaeon]